MNWRQRLRYYGIAPVEVAICAVLSFATALVLGFHAGLAAGTLSGALVFGMLVIVVTDSRRMLIPDALSLPLIPIGLLAAMAVLPGSPVENLTDHVSAACLAAAALSAVRWAYFRLRGVIGLGLGDVKLAATAGAWLGLEHLPMTLLLASTAALLAVLFHRLFSPGQPLAAGGKVPFGSFIAAAILVVWMLMISRVLSG
jgi:leader peptidase (prepilin peptidase)/N-methyltransferase